MENKDILFTLALNMDLREILNLCRVNKSSLKNICRNNNFWIAKMEKDGIVDYKKIIDVATDDEIESNISPSTFYRYINLGPNLETYKMESPDSTTFAAIIKREDFLGKKSLTVDLLRQVNVDALPQLQNLKFQPFQRKINGIDSYLIPFLRIDNVKRVIAGIEQGNPENMYGDTWNSERGWSDYYGNVIILDISSLSSSNMSSNINSYLYITGDSIYKFKTMESVQYLYTHYDNFSGGSSSIAVTKNLIYTLFKPYTIIPKSELDYNHEYLISAAEYVFNRDLSNPFPIEKII